MALAASIAGCAAGALTRIAVVRGGVRPSGTRRGETNLCPFQLDRERLTDAEYRTRVETRSMSRLSRGKAD